MNPYANDETIYHSIDDLLLEVDFVKTNKKTEIANVPCAFDIETTSFYRLASDHSITTKTPDDSGDWEKVAVMYAFVIGINGRNYVGRTWKECEDAFRKISEFYKLKGKDRTMVFFVHNLAFDFQFFRKRFEWIDVFAMDKRKPLKCVSSIGIEFRCSYLLTGYSLETIGKHLTTYPVEKMTGDLDYKRIRNSKSPLTEAELRYIGHDSLVVMSHIRQELDKFGTMELLPLTKTGYVRKAVRDFCLYEGSHKHNVGKYIRYHRRMTSLIIRSKKEYHQLKRAFMGGFTHANGFHSGDLMRNVESYDFASSYPAVMIAEKYPCGTGRLKKIESLEDAKRLMKIYCCVFDCEFVNIRDRFVWDHYISESKCQILEGKETDNGRIVRADRLGITITNVDFEIIEKTYQWDEIAIRNFRIYPRDYLPRDFMRAVLTFYKKKTELKGVEGSEIEYMNSKENVNSLYGMTATDIVREKFTLDGEDWISEEPDEESELRKYNDRKNRFLCYQWGLFVTSYARRNLWSAILELKDDYIYSDTDSVKIRNAESHQDYFKRYNERIRKKIDLALQTRGFDAEMARPATIEGKVKQLGAWENDGSYTRFKTLGAKRYLVEKKDGKISLTVSGLNGKFAIPYMERLAKERNESIFDLFDEGLYIPKGETGKNLHTYIDYPQNGLLTDEWGNVAEYDELSSVHLEGCDYDFSIASAYVDYLLGIRDVND